MPPPASTAARSHTVPPDPGVDAATLAAAFDGVAGGVAIYGPDDRLIFCNTAYRRGFGLALVEEFLNLVKRAVVRIATTVEDFVQRPGVDPDLRREIRVAAVFVEADAIEFADDRLQALAHVTSQSPRDDCLAGHSSLCCRSRQHIFSWRSRQAIFYPHDIR